MRVAEDRKKVEKIGKIKHFTIAIAEDYIIDMIYNVYEKYKKVTQNSTTFEHFCNEYIRGKYNYTIRQGWEKYVCK